MENNVTIEKPKKKKLNGGQIILIIIPIALIIGFAYYWFCLQPTPENPYVGVWDEVYTTGSDGSYESAEDVYGPDKPLGTRYPIYFYADGNYQYGEGECAIYDIWMETDEYILLVTSGNKFYKEGDKIFIEFRGEITYRSYNEKSDLLLPEKD